MRSDGQVDETDYDDWPYWYDVLPVGAVETNLGADTEATPVLWLPDPEQRHGWREWYCRKPDPERASIGFSYGGAK